MREKTPIYDEIKQFLKSRIDRGEWAEGARLPSEKELVEQLGVGRHRIHPALRELEVEGYIVRKQGNGSFVAPWRNKSSVVRPAHEDTVAMFSSRYSPGYPRQVIHGFMQHMAATSRRSVVYNVKNSKSTETDTIRSVIESGVTGLVLWVDYATEENCRYLTSLVEKRFPIVLVDRYPYGIEIDTVASANEDIGYRLTRALIEIGHTRIAFAGYMEEISSTNERFKGYQQALADADLLSEDHSGPRPNHPFYLDLEMTRSRPDEQVARIMALRHRPTAFVCIHDAFADTISLQLAQMGYKVPGDIELAAVDDGGAQGDVPPARLCIRQQGFDVGAQSADVLLARMAAPDAPVQRRVVKAGPVYRTSDIRQVDDLEGRTDTSEISVASKAS